MKKCIPLFFLLLFAPRIVLSQGRYRKQPALSMAFTLTDFKTPVNIKKDGIGSLFNVNSMWSKGGIAISYIEGLSNHVDIVVGANGTFYDEMVLGNSAPSKNNLLADVFSSFNFKLNTDRNFFTPYFTTGVSIVNYKKHVGISIPGGIGVQFNYKNDLYFLFQSSYYFTLNNPIKDYLRHSFGIAGNIKKRKQQAYIPPPTLPAVAIVQNPDRDGDGIIDTEDRCPDIPGPKFLQGCPDIDGDSIPDIDDRCPAIYGLKRYFGCPIPDTDNDGVNDEIDSCMTIPGVASNAGCPVVDSFSKNIITEAARNIFFETGSDKLLNKSFNALNQVYAILNENKLYAINVEGHTDSIGNNVYNQVLSERRAQAVKSYLVKKGIQPDRIAAKGYGEDKPVADNKTAQGRSMNRRVEITAHIKR